MGNNMEKAGRDMFFDTCKYLLIIMVIAGHVLDSYKHLHPWMEYVYSFIYLFHMPFFAFISGYFSKRLTIRKLTKSSLLLLESFIILQTGFLLLRNHELPDWNSVFTPWYAPWYLMSLIWWRWIAFCCMKINRPALCMTIAILISVFSGFLYGTIAPTSFLSMARTWVFLPFFIGGLYLTKRHIQMIREFNHIPFLITILLIAVSLYFLNGIELNAIEYGNGFHWKDIPAADSMALFTIRLYFLGSAALLTLSFLNLTPALKFCAGFGSNTMFFFSYHIFLLIFLNYYVRRWLHITHPDWWYPLLSVIITVFILNLCSGFKVFYKLLNPVSSVITFLRNKRKP